MADLERSGAEPDSSEDAMRVLNRVSLGRESEKFDRAVEEVIFNTAPEELTEKVQAVAGDVMRNFGQSSVFIHECFLKYSLEISLDEKSLLAGAIIAAKIDLSRGELKRVIAEKVSNFPTSMQLRGSSLQEVILRAFTEIVSEKLSGLICSRGVDSFCGMMNGRVKVNLQPHYLYAASVRFAEVTGVDLELARKLLGPVMTRDPERLDNLEIEDEELRAKFEKYRVHLGLFVDIFYRVLSESPERRLTDGNFEEVLETAREKYFYSSQNPDRRRKRA